MARYAELQLSCFSSNWKQLSLFGAGALPAGALPAETSRFCSLIARVSQSNTTSVRPSPIRASQGFHYSMRYGQAACPLESLQVAQSRKEYV
jgi:hypothetical protein